MASETKTSGRLLFLGAVFATAALVWWGNGLHPWWPLMWFAPLPALGFALRSSWPRAALAAFSGWLLGSANTIVYFHALGTPLPVWLVDFGVFSLIFAFGVLAFRWFVRRDNLWSGVAVLPALFVTADWIRCWTSPHGTSADLAYTQLRFLPFLQLASLTGAWGMTFVLLWVPGAVAACLYAQRQDSRPRWSMLSITSAGLLAVLAFGSGRLLLPKEGPTLTVGLVASDPTANEEVADPGQDAARLMSGYADRAQSLADRGATMIVMPEKIAVVREQDRVEVHGPLQRVSDATGATIAAGELYFDGGAPAKRFNRAQVYRPHTESSHYDKEHMLPPFEASLTPGDQLLTLQRTGSVQGVAVCKDMDFTSMGRRYGRLGVGVMLVPAWDFRLDDVWHGHMAIMRGVESGFSVVRAAKQGSLYVSDAEGRVLAETPSNSAAFATLMAQVPAGHRWTLFQEWGDWFAWLSSVLCACLAVRATRNASSAHSAPESAKGVALESVL